MAKNKYLGATISALFGLLFNSAHAADLLKTGPSVFNYNFADVLYIDEGNLDGIGLRFSADIRENYAVQFEYARISDGGFDQDTLVGGIAYHIQTAKFPSRADWVFDAGLEFIDLGGIDDTGIFLGAGIRYAVSDPLEVNGRIGVSTVFDTDVILNLRALYEVATGFSVYLETDVGSRSDLGLGVRFYWR